MGKPTARSLGYAALRAASEYPKGLAGVSALLTAAGAIAYTGLDAPGSVAAGVAAVGAAGLLGTSTYWWVKYVDRPGVAKRIVERENEEAQRSAGLARRLDLAERASRKALRLKAQVLKPSLQDLPRRKAMKVDPREIGTLLVYLGHGWFPGEELWVSCEHHTLRTGGPRRGKTASLALHGINAPGCLITTSTRSDLAEWVHSARKACPVHIWNPSGYVDMVSTVQWRVLTDCEDFEVASRRATVLIPPEGGSKDSEDWRDQARRVLALLLNAAALRSGSMSDVRRWVARPDDRIHQQEMLDGLMKARGGAERGQELSQFFTTNDRTRSSIIAVMQTGLAWMSSDTARILGDSPAGSTNLDIRKLILNRETLHVVGHEKSKIMAPLNAALVDEIGHQARVISGEMRDDRLDPPMTMLLDEVGLVAPVPLDQWSADFGGRNVQMHISVQSIAQLTERWGEAKAKVLLGNLGALMVFGGGSDYEELQGMAALSGEARHRVVDVDEDKPDGFRWAAAVSSGMIRGLREGMAYVVCNDVRPTIGWAPMVFEDKRIKREYLGQKKGRVAAESDVEKRPKVDPLTPEEIAEEQALLPDLTKLKPTAFGSAPRKTFEPSIGTGVPHHNGHPVEGLNGKK